MTPTTKVTALAALLAAGVIATQIDGGTCRDVTALTPDAGYALFSLCAGTDGGFDDLPAGVEAVPGTIGQQWSNTLGLRSTGRSAAPFACACSPGPACLGVDGGPAPQHITLQPGAFTGTCISKPCVELAGRASSWPSACP